MTCPRCGATIKASMSKCAKCGLPLNYEDKVAGDDKLPLKNLLGRAALVVLAGILILGVVNNGLVMLKVDDNMTNIVKGCIIIGSVVLDMRKNAKKK